MNSQPGRRVRTGRPDRLRVTSFPARENAPGHMVAVVIILALLAVLVATDTSGEN